MNTLTAQCVNSSRSPLDAKYAPMIPAVSAWQFAGSVEDILGSVAAFAKQLLIKRVL
jgi:hypothetical protein